MCIFSSLMKLLKKQFKDYATKRLLKLYRNQIVTIVFAYNNFKPPFLVLFASWWLTFFLMLLFRARKNLIFRQQSKQGRNMPLCHGGTKYLWNVLRRKQNHESRKQYFGVLNKKTDKLWKLSRLGTVKS